VEVIVELRTKVADNERFKNHLTKVYPDLTEEEVNKICCLKYKGWSPLSKKLLVDIKSSFTNDATGEIKTYNILQYLLYTNANFMSIYKNNLTNNTFKKQVEEINKTFENDDMISLNELIDNTYLAPSMKRSLRQALKVIGELTDYMNHKLHIKNFKFNKIFVESSREKQENKKTNSRKEQINEAYENAKKLITQNNLEELKYELSTKSDSELRAKKLFLYFMQLGRDVYTGERININELNNYEIDHIIPRSFGYKDDSFDNTVLIDKKLNNNRQDEYPIPNNILNKNGRDWIKTLNKIKNKQGKSYLMPTEKMNRILSRVGFNDEQIVGFVNRQLTMTNQAVKAVCDILISLGYDSQNIIYSKACFVSDFRNVYNLFKIRELNNFHHAHDAYLNIVVGNFYNRYFGSVFTAKKYKDLKNDNKTIKTNIDILTKADRCLGNSNNFYWIAPKEVDVLEVDENNNITKEKLSWRNYLKKKENLKGKNIKIKIVEYYGGTYETIKTTLSKCRPLVTHMIYENKGKFFDQKPLSKDKKGIQYPLKKDLKDKEFKYGGYSGLNTSYFALIKLKKGYKLQPLPLIYIKEFKGDIQEFLKLIIKENFEIIIDKLKLCSCIEYYPLNNFNNINDGSYVKLGLKGGSITENRNSYSNYSEFSIKENGYLDNTYCISYHKYLKQIISYLGLNLDLNKKNKKDEKKENESKLSDDEFEKLYFNKHFTKENNKKLLEAILDSIKNKFKYKAIPELDIDKLIEGFDNKSIIDQMEVIGKVLNEFSQQAQHRLSNTALFKDKRVFITNYSITGLFKTILFQNEERNC